MITTISELWKQDASVQDKFIRETIFDTLVDVYMPFIEEILSHYESSHKVRGSAVNGFRRGLLAYLRRKDLPKDMKFSNFVSWFIKSEIESQAGTADDANYDTSTESAGPRNTDSFPINPAEYGDKHGEGDGI